MAVIVALDAGTTGVRALGISDTGEIVGLCHREFTQHFPRPGWVEHDPEEIWEAACHSLGGLQAELSEPIAAIGITNQRETAVIWDKDSGQADQRAIVWQDRRTAEQCQSLQAAGHLPLIRSQTGLVLDPYFSATKFAWLKQRTEIPPGRQAFGTVDSWLLWKLTQHRSFATEPSNASRTMLYDINRRQWSPELCELFDIPPAALPEVLASSGVFGHTQGSPLPDGIPIAGIAGDQQAALFGQACFGLGDAKNTYGTGSFVLMNIGPEPPASSDLQGLLTSVGWELSSGEVAYVLEGSIFVTGALVQWLRDGMEIIGAASELEGQARLCEDQAGCVIVPAFVGLGSPWWDPDARGAIWGLSADVGVPQLARAAIGSMSWQTRDVVREMERVSGRQLATLRVDGGAAVMDTLLAHQADTLGAVVSRPKVTESTARGAGWLAGLAVGVWGSLEELADQWELDREFSPSGHDRVREGQLWERAVQRTMALGHNA